MLKLLYISPNYMKRVNWGHQLFRNAIKDNPNCKYIQYGEGMQYKGSKDVIEILSTLQREENFIPEMIMLENWKNIRNMTGWDRFSGIVRGLYLGDYLPDQRGNIQQYNKLINDYGIQVVFCPVPEVQRQFSRCQREGAVSKDIQAVLLPYSVDIDVYKPRPMKKIYDVMAVFGLVSYVYPMRPNVQAMIKKMPVSSLIGDWKSGIKHFDYAKALSQSKIFVSVNGINNQITMKYTEAMSSGCLLLTNRPKDFTELGFKPGEHCVCWSSLHDLEERILYYLDHEDERKAIAKAGKDFVRENYSTTVLAVEFVSYGQSLVNDLLRDSVIGEDNASSEDSRQSD